MSKEDEFLDETAREATSIEKIDSFAAILKVIDARDQVTLIEGNYFNDTFMTDFGLPKYATVDAKDLAVVIRRGLGLLPGKGIP